jgi:hypothetical protein
MKKFLAIIILVAIFSTCCVFPVFAEDEQTPAEPVVLLQDDMLANKGTTTSHLSDKTAWIEQDQLLEAGIDSFLVYKLTDAQKALVTNYATLEAAIAKYEELTKPTTPPEDEKDPDNNEQNTGNNNNNNTQPKDDGCGSVMTLGSATAMLLSAAWVTLAARKKQD